MCRNMIKTMRFILFLGALFFFSCSAPAQQGITGLWKSRDQNSDKPRSLVAIYEYEGKYYGRMLATYNDDGTINDTICEKKDNAPGVVGNPPYCGMDFVYNLKQKEVNGELIDKYRGKVIDPEKGKVYNAEVWRQGEVLIFRGELWIFGKNIPWKKASISDLPKGFSMRDIKHFVPIVPKPCNPP